MPGKPNPLLDVQVRQALWHAVDLNTIQKRLMRGKSRTSGTLVAPPKCPATTSPSTSRWPMTSSRRSSY